ncbi:MAG: tetratricopeptide repeat protein [Bacteroidota bacterium]
MQKLHSNQTRSHFIRLSLSQGILIGCFVLAIGLVSCKSSQPIGSSTDPGPPKGLDELTLDKEKVDKRYVDACTHMIRGDLRVAMDLFKEVLKLVPDHHASMYNIAKLAIEQRQYDDAITYASRALDADKTNYWYYQVLKQAYEFKGEFARAIEVQEEIVRQFPAKIDDRIQLAELYIRNREMNKGITTLTQIEEEMGPSDEISLRKFQIFMRQKEYDQALVIVNQLLDGHPSEPRFYQMKYDVLNRLGKNAEGILVLDELLDRDPDNGFALLSLADHYRKLNNTEKSDFYLFQAFENPEIEQSGKIQIIQNLLRMTPDNPSIFPRVQKLAAIFNRTHPGSAQAYALQGKLFLLDSKVDSARLYYRKSLDIESSNIPVWLDLIETSFGTRDFQQLYKDAEEALEFYPNQEQFLYFLGISGSQIGEYRSATNALEKIKRIGTAGEQLMAQACAELGQLYHYQKEYEKSDKNFDQALRYTPDDDILLNNYAYFLSERNSRLSEAQELIEKALDTQPEQPSYLDTYGWILFKQGKYNEAEKWIKKAVDLNPDAEILEHYGDVLYKLGKKDDAKIQWERARVAGSELDLDKKLNQ